MKKIRQIAAWIGIIVVLGLVVATFILSICGSSLSMGMLVLTMGVSIILWVCLWFLRILENRNSDQKSEEDSKNGTE